MTSDFGQTAAVPSSLMMALRHSIVESGLRIGWRPMSNPLRRIHWISPIQTDTRASSAAYGLISMPSSASGPTVGKRRGKPITSPSIATRRSIFFSSTRARYRKLPEPQAGSRTRNARSRARKASNAARPCSSAFDQRPVGGPQGAADGVECPHALLPFEVAEQLELRPGGLSACDGPHLFHELGVARRAGDRLLDCALGRLDGAVDPAAHRLPFAQERRVMTGSMIIMILSRSVYSAPVSERLSGSRPRTNSVPKMDGSISLQSRRGGAQAHGDVVGRQRQRLVVVEQAAVEPFDPVEADQAAVLHGAEQGGSVAREPGPGSPSPPPACG